MTDSPRARLAAAIVALGTARAERRQAAGPSEAAEPADPMAAWMAAQAAGGEKEARHPALAALCCVVSPVQEFLQEFVSEPIKGCRRRSAPAPAAAPAEPTPSEAGVLDLQVGAPAWALLARSEVSRRSRSAVLQKVP